MDFKKVIESSEYDFLRTNPNIKDRILFLVVGGSHSYGTNIETSDVDVRGVVLDSKEMLLGFDKFENFIDKTTDTTIYSLTTFIKLISNCNPNIVEMLFCKPEHYIYISPLGQLILDNRHLFLTKRAFYTFGGYARSQLTRIENALYEEEKIDKNKKTEFINRSLTNALFSFEEKHNIPIESIKTRLEENEETELDEIVMEIDIDKVPVKKMVALFEEVRNILKDFEKKNKGNANNKRSVPKMNKHMMHLVRLLLMAIEILTTKDLHTYRETDLPLLMDIRNGKYQNDEGLTEEFDALLESLNLKLEEAKEISELSMNIDKEKIDKLVIEIFKEAKILY